MTSTQNALFSSSSFSSSAATPQLLALDWGTSRLRAFLMAGGEVIAERDSAHGIQHLPVPGSAGYASALATLAGDWLSQWPRLPLMACGMVGSAQGWREAPYVRCPADTAALAAHCVAVETSLGRTLWIVPGVLFDDGQALPDVMRGEETQIAGAVQAGAEAQTFILPGTHSKWAQVEDGRIVRFETYLTGELYAVLRGHSLLGRLMPEGESPGHEAAFGRGVAVAAASRPGELTHQLFSVRTLALTGQLAAEALPDYLSGLLIGHEIISARAAAPGLGGARPRRMIGEPALCRRYARAFEQLGEAAPEILTNSAPRGLWQLACAAGLILEC